ncbi:LysR family transcriptional regulator, partial [Salmonella enterica]|nr:LysR family transcriptional regulator [Salmonella enterica]
MLSLTQLAAYVAIIETGTFQKAAERLGVSQPTVSQSLRNLESYLGVALVLRNRIRCEATPAGAKLLRHARTLTRLAADAEMALLQERVAIGASGNIGTYLLPPFVKRFVDTGIDQESIGVTVASNPEVATALDSGEVDVGIMEWWDDRPGFTAMPWRKEEMVVITPPTHRWASRSHVSRDELLETPLIGGEPGTGTARLLRTLFGTAEGDLRVSYAMGSTEGVKSAVKAGLGVSLVLAASVQDELAAGTLHAARIAELPISKELQIGHCCKVSDEAAFCLIQRPYIS